MAVISKAEVIDIKSFGEEIREYTLKLNKNYFFESGTFLLLTLEEKEDYTRWPESRNFTIASAYNEDGIIRLIIRKVGYYTSRIFDELQVGKMCVVKYSFGDFMLPFYDQTNPICCIVAGTGVAPVLGFCEELDKKSQLGRLHVFYSFKNKDEAVGLDILKKYVPANQLYLHSTREEVDNTTNRRILEKDIIDKKLLGIQSNFYICGSSEFTSKFKNFLEEQGVEDIYTDEW